MRLIAEFCQNHNGDFDTLLRMVDAAAEGGATHAKVQTIFADDVAFRDRFEQGQTDPDGTVNTIKRPYQAEVERLRGLELSYEQQRRFVDACRAAGLEPLTTAFNLTCIPHISELGWSSVKVASYDCGSLPLIEALAARFQEIILSTGASYDHEIEAAATYLRDRGTRFSLLHCVTIYPTPLADMNLARLNYLRNLCPSVGLSDHSLVARDGVKAALAAIHLGADTIERHFTVLAPDQSRDGPVSIRKEHLRQIRDFASLSHDDQKHVIDTEIPEFSAMIGAASRPLSHAELVNRDYYRGRFCNKVDGQQVFNWEDGARMVLARAG